MIAARRDEKGIYKTLFDLCKIEGNVNLKVLESLIQVGADGLSGHRAQMFDAVDTAIKYGQRFLEEKNSSQASLFGGEGGTTESVPTPDLKEADEWTSEECLIREKIL